MPKNTLSGAIGSNIVYMHANTLSEAQTHIYRPNTLSEVQTHTHTHTYIYTLSKAEKLIYMQIHYWRQKRVHI